jgi:hypothetical protein
MSSLKRYATYALAEALGGSSPSNNRPAGLAVDFSNVMSKGQRPTRTLLIFESCLIKLP